MTNPYEVPERLVQPPQAIEVEKHVIGALFLDMEAVSIGLKCLKPEEFYLNRHTEIWAAITHLSLRGLVVDLMSVAERLKVSGKLEAAGGDAYLMEISSEVVSSANVAQHCEIIKEKSVLRTAIVQATRILGMAYNAADPVEVVREMERAAMITKFASTAGRGLHLVSPDVWTAEAKLAYDKVNFRGFSTGWDGLDQLYRPTGGETHVWTGIPGHGKSEMLDALMFNLAWTIKWRIAYFSPENKTVKHIQKLAEKQVGKPLFGLARMPREEYHWAIDDFLVNQFLFFKDGDRGTSFAQVLLDAQRIDPPINALVVDPWNMLEVDRPGKMNEQEYILHCLRLGRRWVEQTGADLHIVSHPTKLSADFKSGEIKVPGLYDISGSAHWNNSIDNGFSVFRNRKSGRTELYVLKLRDKDRGETGCQEFIYDRPSGRYTQAGQPKKDSQMTPAPAVRAQSKAYKPAPPPVENDLPF